MKKIIALVALVAGISYGVKAQTLTVVNSSTCSYDIQINAADPANPPSNGTAGLFNIGPGTSPTFFAPTVPWNVSYNPNWIWNIVKVNDGPCGGSSTVPVSGTVNGVPAPASSSIPSSNSGGVACSCGTVNVSWTDNGGAGDVTINIW